MNTQIIVTLITAAFSFLTMCLVGLVGYIFVSRTGTIEATANKAHERLDEHILDNGKEHTEIHKEIHEALA